jgi:hypothetical protein
MTYPKSLTICGIKYKLVFHPKVHGGEFYWFKHLIRIEKGLTAERKWVVLIHEIAEIIMIENVMRYQKCLDQVHNGDYLFSFDHDRFEIFTNELAGVLKQIAGMK